MVLTGAVERVQGDPERRRRQEKISLWNMHDRRVYTETYGRGACTGGPPPRAATGPQAGGNPLALIIVITVVDIHSPPDVHLGPLLVIAPALTASVAGPRLTALVGALAVAAQVLIAVYHGGLTTPNHLSQITALILLSALVVFVCHVRERRSRELNRARSVAETAQLVLLRPPRRRIGPLRVAWLYLAAEDETRIGGDLFAIARSDRGTRVIIGDVRGKGLAAIGEASMVLGAFREGAHRYDTLPELAAGLEVSVCRSLEDAAATENDPGEHFITALLLDIPDQGTQVEMVNLGHPPPLLLHDGQVTVLHARRPVPPWACASCPYPATARTPSRSRTATHCCSTPTASSKPVRPKEPSTLSPSAPPTRPPLGPRP